MPWDCSSASAVEVAHICGGRPSPDRSQTGSAEREDALEAPDLPGSTLGVTLSMTGNRRSSSAKGTPTMTNAAVASEHGSATTGSAGQITAEQFELDARAFLDVAAPKRPTETLVWGEGSDHVGLFPERTPEQQVADLAAARSWAQGVFDAGFGWITGPPEYGGRGLPREYQRAYASIAADYKMPSMSVYGIGLGMVAPTILAHATDEVKDAYLRRMHRGDLVACQLFSEPSSGSDLASLQTRAVRDGDEWLVNGQKVWTSGAHYSEIGEILCRTDLDAPKH